MHRVQQHSIRVTGWGVTVTRANSHLVLYLSIAAGAFIFTSCKEENKQQFHVVVVFL